MQVNPLNNLASSSVNTSSSASSNVAGTPSGFENELSAVLAQSISKLIGTQDVQITVRNGNGGLRREIVISYDSAAVAAEGPAATATTSPSANPFSITASAPTVPASAPPQTPWAPTDAPKDKRDAIPAGGGSVTSSGAPLIQLNAEPASNQYGYTGPAARNPYFTTPSNPLREGYVVAFQNWFQDNFVLGGVAGPAPTSRIFHASGDGANEALRLVQQYAPGAKIVSSRWDGGPFSTMKETLYIELPDGRRLNAGGVVHSYYNQGQGVTAYSDTMLERTIRQA